MNETNGFWIKIRKFKHRTSLSLDWNIKFFKFVMIQVVL